MPWPTAVALLPGALNTLREDYYDTAADLVTQAGGDLDDVTTASETHSVHGVTVRIWRAPNHDDDTFVLKRSQVTAALEQMCPTSGGGFAFPGNVLEVLMEPTGVSRGMLYRRTGAILPRAFLQLGGTVTDVIDRVSPDPVNAPRGGLGVGTPHNLRLVADQVYDYYRPTFTVNALRRRVRTAIFHELGHVFHQLDSPDDYWAIADETGTNNWYAVRGNRYTNALLSWPVVEREHIRVLRVGVAEVSRYGGLPELQGGVNEFVAEMFSGLMMGVPYSAAALNEYAAAGGPATRGQEHARDGQGANKQRLYSLFKRA
ncbi:hypothetical protein P2318_34705 [Myxococcaceae bacterium GXIMD 01537]